MSELVQWIIAAIVVLLAAVYLVRRIARPRGSCASTHDCANCLFGAKYRDRCKDRQDP
jgi:hypothetical protein